MAEVLEIGKMLSETYEPLRAFRWIVEIDGIDSFLAESISRPKDDVEEVESRYINTVQFFAGRMTPQPIDFQLKESIAPSQAQKVKEWVRAVHEYETGRSGYKAMYTRDVVIKMLSPTGEVVQQWKLINAWPQNFNPSDLSYMDNDISRINLTIRYDRSLLLF